MEYCANQKRNLYIASSHYCLNQTFTFHERLMVQVWMNVHILCLEKLGSLTDICSLNFVECQTQLVLGVLFMQWISFCCSAILELLQASSFFATEIIYLYLDGSQPLLYFVPCSGFSQSSWLDYLRQCHRPTICILYPI